MGRLLVSGFWGSPFQGDVDVVPGGMLVRHIPAWVDMDVLMQDSVIEVQNAPVVQGDQPGCGLMQKIPVVGDDEQGLLQTVEQGDEVMPGIRVEPSCGFVQEQGLRLHGQDSGQ
mgnify:CR=1 FL=1